MKVTILALLLFGQIYAFTYVPGLSHQHGKVSTQLFLSSEDQQGLIVAFGGGVGGNDWARSCIWKE